MTRRSGAQIPRERVFLPDDPMIGAAHLQDALGVSKARLHLWRRRQGFPLSHRQGRDTWTDTGAVRLWLETRGVIVTIAR